MDDMNSNDLIAAVIAKQRAHGWSYRDMGRELGINHTTWFYIVKGRQGLTVPVVRKILARFPELAPQAFLYLQPDAINAHVTATNPNDRDDAA